MKIHYNPELKELSARLRNNSTLSKVLLWDQLKGKKCMVINFMRKAHIYIIIVDFFCNKLKPVIEVDGCSHQNGEAHKANLSVRKKWKNQIFNF